MTLYQIYNIKDLSNFCSYLRNRGYSATYRGGYSVVILDSIELNSVVDEYLQTSWLRPTYCLVLEIIKAPTTFNKVIAHTSIAKPFNFVEYTVYNGTCILSIFSKDNLLYSEEVTGTGLLNTGLITEPEIEIRARNKADSVSIVERLALCLKK